MLTLWDRYFGKKEQTPWGMAPPEYQKYYTPLAEEVVIEETRKEAVELFENLKGSHSDVLWPQLRERVEEILEEEIEHLRWLFSMRRGESPWGCRLVDGWRGGPTADPQDSRGA